MKVYDTIIVGGGQAGLSVAYFLRRHKLDYLILDDQDKAGGSWPHTWKGLKLFSPTAFSSLSGWAMPKGATEYPTRDDFIAYLEAYEARYQFPILRNTHVSNVYKEDSLFRIETSSGVYYSKALVSATGTANAPFLPQYGGQDLFGGSQIHSSSYYTPDEYAGKKVLIVGGGNSGAQILAEVSKVATTLWVTLNEPVFLPDDIDGRYLFDAATRKYQGRGSDERLSLSSIVAVESVREARNRQVYKARRPFKSFYREGIIWPNNQKEEIDAVIWCTGFKTNFSHLRGLDLIEDQRIITQHTRSVKEPMLWLVGYGNWTGFASATIYGVGKTARATGREIRDALINM